jgi:hypothetical protein
MFIYVPFSIQGIANSTQFDIGIESTEKEKKRLVAVWVNVSQQVGNRVELWIEKSRIMSVPDWLLDTREQKTTANAMVSTTKIAELPINVELAVGERARLALACDATATRVDGVYVYEPM